LDEAARLVDLFAEFADSGDVQERGAYACGKAWLHLARGEIDEAMNVALASVETHEAMGITSEYVKDAFVVAVEAALRLGDTDRAESLLAVVDRMPSGRRPQFLRAQSFRFHAHLAARRGDPSETERLFKQAAGLLREMVVPFSLGVVLLEHGEWLVEQGRSSEAEPLLTEAREIFDHLHATPWIERVDRSALLVTS
jgi:ATP/maltotriose-dependent transcriptional regulator MalT